MQHLSWHRVSDLSCSYRPPSICLSPHRSILSLGRNSSTSLPSSSVPIARFVKSYPNSIYSRTAYSNVLSDISLSQTRNSAIIWPVSNLLAYRRGMLCVLAIISMIKSKINVLKWKIPVYRWIFCLSSVKPLRNLLLLMPESFSGIPGHFDVVHCLSRRIFAFVFKVQ